MDGELLKFMIKYNRAQYTVIYDSMVLLQEYIKQMQLTADSIQNNMEICGREDTNGNMYFFYKSVELASRIPVLETPSGVEDVDILWKELLWLKVYAMLYEFICKCKVDIAMLESAVVVVTSLNSRKSSSLESIQYCAQDTMLKLPAPSSDKRDDLSTEPMVSATQFRSESYEHGACCVKEPDIFERRTTTDSDISLNGKTRTSLKSYTEGSNPLIPTYDSEKKIVERPRFTYLQLIVQAITSAVGKKLTLRGICQFIAKKYPYYRLVDKSWQNSIRHNLSLDRGVDRRYFMKVPQTSEHGCFWMVGPIFQQMLLENAYKTAPFRRGFRFKPSHKSSWLWKLSPSAGRKKYPKSNAHSREYLLHATSFWETEENVYRCLSCYISPGDENHLIQQQQQQQQQRQKLHPPNQLPKQQKELHQEQDQDVHLDLQFLQLQKLLGQQQQPQPQEQTSQHKLLMEHQPIPQPEHEHEEPQQQKQVQQEQQRQQLRQQQLLQLNLQQFKQQHSLQQLHHQQKQQEQRNPMVDQVLQGLQQKLLSQRQQLQSEKLTCQHRPLMEHQPNSQPEHDHEELQRQKLVQQEQQNWKEPKERGEIEMSDNPLILTPKLVHPYLWSLYTPRKGPVKNSIGVYRTLSSSGSEVNIQIGSDLGKHIGGYMCYRCNQQFEYKHSLVSHIKSCSMKLKCKTCDEEFASSIHLTDHLKQHHQLMPREPSQRQLSYSGMLDTAKKEPETNIVDVDRSVSHIGSNTSVKEPESNLADVDRSISDRGSDTAEKELESNVFDAEKSVSHSGSDTAEKEPKSNLVDVDRSVSHICSNSSMKEPESNLADVDRSISDRRSDTAEKEPESNLFDAEKSVSHSGSNTAEKKPGSNLVDVDRSVTRSDLEMGIHEVRYWCDKCDKCFENEHDLESHAKLCPKMLQCTFCDKWFSEPTDLVRHFNQHHQMSEEDSSSISDREKPSYFETVNTWKKETCNECNKQFQYGYSWFEHQRSCPMLLKCNLCDRWFPGKVNLADHMKRSHTIETPYQCNYCELSFPNKNGLVKHVLSHTRIMHGYQYCDLCGKCFASEKFLLQHMEMHMKNEN